MRITVRLLAILLICTFVSSTIVGQQVWAGNEEGKLDKLEKRLGDKKKNKKDSEERRKSGPSAQESLLVNFIQLFFSFLSQGTFRGLDGVPAGERHALLRKEWHPTLPTIRLEGGYHNLLGNDDIRGYAVNVQGGFLNIGLELDWRHLYEQTPATQLKVISPHFLIRAAPFDFMEIDLALGAKIIRGRNSNTGFELGLPMYFYLGKHFILDMKPYGSVISGTNIYDFSAGASVKFKVLGVRGGYRILDIGGESLHGPQAGVFFQW